MSSPRKRNECEIELEMSNYLEDGMRIYKLIAPLGVVTYVLLVAVITSGLLGIKGGYHPALAVSALVVATLHASAVISVKIKAKRASKRRSS